MNSYLYAPALLHPKRSQEISETYNLQWITSFYSLTYPKCKLSNEAPDLDESVTECGEKTFLIQNFTWKV